MSDVINKDTGEVEYTAPSIVIDNLLDPQLFEHIRHTVLNDYSWRAASAVAYKESWDTMEKTDPRYLHDIQSVNVVYVDSKIRNDFLFETIQPILTKLKVAHLIRAKFNMTYAAPTQDTDLFYHADYNKESTYDGMKIAVINFSTCNGGTIFEESKDFVSSVENRAIIFNAKERHSGVHCTDERFRLVLNLVYFPDMSDEEKVASIK